MRATTVLLLAVCIVIASAIAQQQQTLKLKGQRLISRSENHVEWMTEAQIKDLMNKNEKFIDITDHLNDGTSIVTPDPLPVAPTHKSYVDELIPQLSKNTLNSTLTTLSAFPTRFCTTDDGVAAAKWIAAQFSNYSGDNRAITVELFPHQGLPQPSVIATIPGVGPHKDQFVVIGAHEDSVSLDYLHFAPGADDDGSGIVCLLEVFRVLVQAGYAPDRTIKFMAYAAEEIGLVGSLDIVSSYVKANANVYGVLQYDMVGYGVGPVGIMTDYVDANLTQFLRLLVDSYSDLGRVDTACGYGCSDHYSWTKAGYRSSRPYETTMENSNPYIHSVNDTMDKISMDRILEFSKIGLGFVVELGGIATEN